MYWIGVFLLLSACCIIQTSVRTYVTANGAEDGGGEFVEELKSPYKVKESRTDHNPCCAFPCQHGGICISCGSSYKCDCTGLGYYGVNCSQPYLWQVLRNVLEPSSEVKMALPHKFKWFWNIVNRVPSLHKRFIRLVYELRISLVSSPPRYNSAHEFTTLDSYYNRSYYARELPPVPPNCPTPMGIAGPAVLPSIDDVFERILKRQTFIPCPHGTNILFVTYAQYFIHQFFATDERGVQFSYGNNEGVDVSQIYGLDEARRRALRSYKDGKMKTSIIRGEEFPPYLKDAPEVHMVYPSAKDSDVLKRLGIMREQNVNPKWAFGHKMHSMTPFLFVMSTLWLREHNRVCDVLKKEYPAWDDERLYQTTRLIICGEMIHITIEDYVQHLSQYHIQLMYDPELTHGQGWEYSNRIQFEFNAMYNWHSMVPEGITVNNTTYKLEDLIFTNNSIVFEHGLDTLVAAMVSSQAGKLTHHNTGPIFEYQTKRVMSVCRELRVQSFNNYRKSFRLRPYKSFLELTGDPTLSKDLEELYGDVDALEFYIGLAVEKHTYSVVPPTMVTIGAAWSIKGLMANPIGSPGWWKPSTFGGEVGFNIIKSSTLEKLVCNNLKHKCDGFKASFAMPQEMLVTVVQEERVAGDVSVNVGDGTGAGAGAGAAAGSVTNEQTVVEAVPEEEQTADYSLCRIARKNLSKTKTT